VRARAVMRAGQCDDSGLRLPSASAPAACPPWLQLLPPHVLVQDDWVWAGAQGLSRARAEGASGKAGGA